MATAQITFRFSHAEVGWVSAVNTTDASKDDIININQYNDKRFLQHALVSTLPGLVTLVPADHQGQVLPTPDLLAVVTNRQHSLDLVRTGATVLEAGQLALVL